MAAAKHNFAHKTALSSPIALLLMSIYMFLRSRNPIKHMRRLITYIFILKFFKYCCYNTNFHRNAGLPECHKIIKCCPKLADGIK